MFFLCLFVYIAWCSQVPTECNQQLHTYYVSLGVPMLTPVQQAVTFTSGVNLGVPYVTMNMAFQETARFYANLLPNTTLANQSFSSFISVDLPWCTTDIDFQCCDSATLGTSKTQCTTISDFDQGGSSVVAGRFFLYLNQSTSCKANISVTFSNTTLIASQNQTVTYDVLGLRDHLLLAPRAVARQVYRTSTCLFSNGDPADVVTQNQFVCIEPQIGCNATRENGLASLEIIPIPSFKCIGQLSPNASVTEVLWIVANQQPNYGIEGSFGITFTNNIALAAPIEIAYQASGESYILLPTTSRQFSSGYPNFDHWALLLYQGRWNSYRPLYAFSNDPKIAAVPCVCDFSMVCDVNGSADLISMATSVIRLNNQLPICQPGPALFLAYASPNFTLNATGSYDPDNLPSPLTVRWAIYSTPYDPNPPPFNITDPNAFLNTVDSSNLTIGSYVFILWVSDLQSQVGCLWNVTILANQVFAITELDRVDVFSFYAGNMVNHSCAMFPPEPYLTVNGSYSYGTVPTAPLYFFWEQIGGDPLSFLCDSFGFRSTRGIFNTTQPILVFVPPGPGLYVFRLTVTDNVTNSSIVTSVTVVPDFGNPQGTITPITNFTPVPIRNLTQPTRPILNFSNASTAPFATFAPIAPPPPINITVPPALTVLPPITGSEYVSMIAIFLFMLLLFAFCYAIRESYGDVIYNRIFDKIVYGGVNSNN